MQTASLNFAEGEIAAVGGLVEVRDPERDICVLCMNHHAPRTLPDLESCWDVAAVVAAVSCHLEIQVDILAGELYLELFIWFLESWREIFENGDRGSTQNFDTNLMSIVVWPADPF